MGSNANIFAGIGKLFQGGAGFAGALSEASAAELQGVYQRQQYETNRELSNMAASEAIRRGEQVVGKVRRESSAIAGAQRAALAAQGIDIGSGSAAEVQEQSRFAAEQDILTAKNNAWREAWGFKVQGAQYGAQGRFAEAAGRATARSTILTGGLRSLGYGLESAGHFFPGKGG